MTSVARDVAAFLEANDIGVFASPDDWSLNVSREPVSPDNCITIFDTPGGVPDTDEQDEQAAFQIRIRCTDYEAGIAKARACRDALILQRHPVMNGTPYMGVFMTQGIANIGRDDTDRFLITATYRTVLERN